MSLPLDLQARLDDPNFWRAYFDEDDRDGDAFEDEDGEAGESPLIVEFAVGGGYGLVLRIDNGWSRLVNLEMRTPARTETLRLGWDEPFHDWHPDALRWAELDLIARAAAIVTPDLRHPGPVLALASRFVVLGPDDDLDAITPLMDAAYGPPPSGATWWPSTRDWLYRADGRYNGVVWQQDGTGNWTVDQDEANNLDRDLYSLRCPDGDFPFDAWRDLLAAVEVTLTAPTLPDPRNKIEECWIEEVGTGAPRGSLIASRFGPSPLRDSRRYLLDLYLPAQGRRPSAYSVEVGTDLDRSLRKADRGWAVETGSSSAPGHGYTGFSLSIGITDDLDAGVALVRRVLRRHAAGPETRLTRNRELIPLD